MSNARSTGEHIATGRLGEKLAREYLTNAGYTILNQNERTPYGEIDIIATQDDVYIFVEVKTRRSKSLGPPEISVDSRKQAHLLNAVAFYCQHNFTQDVPWRIDVISVQINGRDALPEIIHFENALSG